MARKNKRKNNLNNGLATAGLIMVIALVAAVVYKEDSRMREQEAAYIEEEARLELQIEQEEERTKTLEQRKKYVTTNQYIEEVAREKLGLLMPDEVLIKAKDD